MKSERAGTAIVYVACLLGVILSEPARMFLNGSRRVVIGVPTAGMVAVAAVIALALLWAVDRIDSKLAPDDQARARAGRHRALVRRASLGAGLGILSPTALVLIVEAVARIIP